MGADFVRWGDGQGREAKKIRAGRSGGGHLGLITGAAHPAFVWGAYFCLEKPDLREIYGEGVKYGRRTKGGMEAALRLSTTGMLSAGIARTVSGGKRDAIRLCRCEYQCRELKSESLA